jgi:molybdate transport system ATP-binding protein
MDVSVRHSFGAFAIDVEFRVPPGVTALFGPSGAGKTTILNMIAGFVRPEAGHVSFGDEVILDTARNLALPARLRRIGVVFQDARLFPHLTVEKNLLYGRRRNANASAVDIDAIVSLLGLAPLLRRRPAKLSGGEKSRVALGRALLANPRALLLDEPLASLDMPRKLEILPYLESLARETRIPVLYVSHSLDEVTHLADRMILLSQGHIRAQGPVFELMSRLDLFSGSDHLRPGAILEAAIDSHDATGLTTLSFAGGRLIVPRTGGSPGEIVRIRIEAEDIMLALREPADVSANNVLPAIVSDMRMEGPYADLQLAIGEARLVSRITRRSAERLKLAPGTKVFALIKSVTVGERANKNGLATETAKP